MIRKIKRLPEVMKVSADTIEGLYKELKRAPPPDVEALIRELHELARDVLTSQEYLNAKVRL
jgi:hypothetical protein